MAIPSPQGVDGVFVGHRTRCDAVLSTGIVGCLVALGFTSIGKSFVPGVLLPLCILGALAFAPRLNPLLYWPVGLMATIVIGYGAYVIDWFTGVPGISSGQARLNLGILLVGFGVTAMLRSALRPVTTSVGSRWGLVQSVLISAAPIVVLFIGSRRLENDSLALFSGYMSGGDHGLHNEIVHDLLAWSATPSTENPFTLYTYPRGIHYLVAQLVTVGSDPIPQNLLMREYLTGAWFEYVQLAAFIQLSVVVFVHWSRDNRWVRVGFVPPLLLVFASMDSFVAHLFWSGFMTSTAMTWALLVPVALWVASRDSEIGAVQRVDWMAVWLLLMAFSWIVYQPYLMPIIAMGLICVITVLRVDKMPQTLVLVRNRMVRHRAWAAFGLSGAIAVSPYFVLGRDSPAISSLFLSGASWRPHLGTVILWVAASLLLCTMTTDQEDEIFPAPVILLSSLVGFSAAMAGIVFVAGDDGLFDMPYYIQKMLWILLYTSVPIALGAGASQGLRRSFFAERGTRAGRFTSIWLMVALVPLVQGRTPNTATSHVSVNWFANGVFERSPMESEANSAFTMVDPLGSHLSNLSLRSASTFVLPPDVSLSGNPYLACTEMLEGGVTTIYTAPNGRAELYEAGCSSTARYIEDGVILPPISRSLFEVSLGEEERFGKGDLGFRLAQRGFTSLEEWGARLGGYQSSIGFKYPKSLDTPTATVLLRRNVDSWSGSKVTIRIDDRVVGQFDFADSLRGEFEFPLPEGPAGMNVMMSFTCQRTKEEILADLPSDGPAVCLGLESLLVSDGP